MPAVELDQAMRADFEAWSVSAGFAYRNHQGFWFYRNGGDGMFEAYCAGYCACRITHECRGARLRASLATMGWAAGERRERL